MIINMVITMKEIERDIDKSDVCQYISYELPLKYYIDNNLIFRITELKKYEKK
jgi:hypothetical protein